LSDSTTLPATPQTATCVTVAETKLSRDEPTHSPEAVLDAPARPQQCATLSNCKIEHWAGKARFGQCAHDSCRGLGCALFLESQRSV